MVSVTSASRNVTSASHYQTGSSMYIQGLIPQNSTALAEAVPIVIILCNLRIRELHFVYCITMHPEYVKLVKKAHVRIEVYIFSM